MTKVEAKTSDERDDTLDLDATVWENVRHASPDAPEQQLRTLLGSFMFSGDQLSQRAGTLSGGEKTRLALAGLVSSAANVLLLDEPTNNLDLASVRQLASALTAYQGALIVASHDRYLIERVTDVAYGMFGDGRLVHLPGGVH